MLAEAIDQVAKLIIDMGKNQHHYYQAVLESVHQKLISIEKINRERELRQPPPATLIELHEAMGIQPVFVTEQLFEIPGRPTKGIAVDVGCKGNPGKTEYRGVDLETGKVLFHMHIPGASTNNIGEFLAAVHGLQHAMSTNDPEYRVYSDSKTAISWVRKQQCRTNFTVVNMDQNRMIKDSELWLKDNGGKVLFWSNEQWGEIPADLSGMKGVPR